MSAHTCSNTDAKKWGIRRKQTHRAFGKLQKSLGPLKVLWNYNRLDKEGMPYVDVFGCGHEHGESHIKHNLNRLNSEGKKKT